MSMEQAILTHALALNDLAAAIRETGMAARAIGMGTPAAHMPLAEEKPAKPAPKKAEAEEKKPVATPVAETPAAKPEAAAESPSDDNGMVDGLDEPLDYQKDVRPVLLNLNRTKGKDALAALLKKYGAATGDKIKPEDFALIRDEANAQLAA